MFLNLTQLLPSISRSSDAYYDIWYNFLNGAISTAMV